MPISSGAQSTSSVTARSRNRHRQMALPNARRVRNVICPGVRRHDYQVKLTAPETKNGRPCVAAVPPELTPYEPCCSWAGSCDPPRAGCAGQGLQAGTGSADGRLTGATLLSEVGACGRRKLGSGEGPAHQSPRPRGRRSSELVRSPPRVCRCHRCPASLSDASAGAELVVWSRPLNAWLAGSGPVAILAVDPIVGTRIWGLGCQGGRSPRRSRPWP
jgi:hypothetical protein